MDSCWLKYKRIEIRYLKLAKLFPCFVCIHLTQIKRNSCALIVVMNTVWLMK